MGECQSCKKKINTTTAKHGHLSFSWGVLGGAGRILCTECTERAARYLGLEAVWPFKPKKNKER